MQEQFNNTNAEDQFERTRQLIGDEALIKLSQARVAVFGIGGVGGHVCETLIRSGISHIDIIDKDKVCLSNINRQIIATHSTLNKPKVDVMRKRLLDINPNTDIKTYETFFLPENSNDFPWDEYDYVIDAIDTVTAKIELIVICKDKGIPVISAMGAGNKLDATAFRIADIYKTKVCPLAKVMRKELRDRGIKELKVVYSEETPVSKAQTPGSIAFVPSVAGLIMAGEVVKDIIKS